MLKKALLLLLLTFLMFSCKLNKDADTLLPGEATDSVAVGTDKDEHGCLASAGYTWSKVSKDCVRVFTGIQLNPIEKQEKEEAILCAYVLFSEDGNTAEIFMPNIDDSLLLVRKDKNEPWVYKDYQLFLGKEYSLKKAGITIYKGDIEAGNKVIESDEPEQGIEQ
ncbi:hypothetical protein [Flavobacterium croceum]|uniref:hypothetical protein n=1 Tax=Flavobacterium croceum TaxID=370975 RepID=UPI0024A96E23|nr:hypothetical protein [Flavobacterium croceum]